MHPDIAAHLERSGFVTRPQVLEAGLDDRHIAAHQRSGDLVWIGPGLYADKPRYDATTPEDKHRLRCHAVHTKFDDAVAFTHQSAALLHGLPVYGVDLNPVQLTRRDGGRGRHQAGVFHHVGEIDDDEISVVADLPVSTVARTVWDVACTESTESGLVTVDAALHQGRVTLDELAAMAVRHTTWRRSRHAKATLARADAAAESPAESRARHAFRVGGLPTPVSQFKIYDGGFLAAITDFAWPEYRHLVEIDGLVKYGRAIDLAREKAREDLLRSLGWGMTRIVWSQLAPKLQPMLIETLRAAMENSRRQFGPLAS